MKQLKILLPVLAIGMLTGCQFNNDNLSSNNQGGGITQNDRNVYAFEAITSVGLLTTLDTNQTVQPIKKAAADETLISQIKDYLPTVEAALYNQSLMTNSEVLPSDREGYQTKVLISYTDIAMTNQSITMYYNETLMQDYDDDDDWDDQEEEYRIDGLIIVNDNEYKMFGEKELDQDEYEISFTYQVDEDSYVKVEQEIENDESEFNYTVINNRRKVYEYSLEIENNEVELEVKDRNLGVEKMEFKFINRNNKTLIIAEIRKASQKSEIVFEKVVDAQTNTIDYVVISNS